MRFIIIIITSMSFSYGAHAATCSCAGVPLTSAMDQSGLSKGAWKVKLNYDLHDISNLIQGSSEISDETNRQRQTISYLLHFYYGLNDQWTLGMVSSYIKHTRDIGISNTDEEKSNGVGDTVLASIYTPFKITPFSRNELALGIAQKPNTGVSNNRSANIIFIEDMQPGTGAPATSAWIYTAHAFSPTANNIIFSSIHYTHNEINKRDYRFGDEWNLTLGYSYESNGPWAYGLSANYRTSSSHERLGFRVPNTGGQWLDLNPSIQYDFHTQFAGWLSLHIPVARDLKGALQFSSRHSIRLGFTYQWE